MSIFSDAREAAIEAVKDTKVSFAIKEVSKLDDAAGRTGADRLDQAVREAVDNNPNFKNYIVDLADSDFKQEQFKEVLAEHNTPADLVAFKGILGDIAANPTASVRNLSIENLSDTITAERDGTPAPTIADEPTEAELAAQAEAARAEAEAAQAEAERLAAEADTPSSTPNGDTLAQAQAEEAAAAAAEAEARALDAERAANPNADLEDSFSIKFLAELNFTEAEYNTALAAAGDDPKLLTPALVGMRDIDQVLDAVAVASPDSADLVEKLKAQPNLKDALHNAMVKDPTVIEGLGKMAENTGDPSKMGLDKLEATLFAKGLKGAAARTAATAALNKIAETDLEFDHLENIGNTISKFDMKDFIKRATDTELVGPLAVELVSMMGITDSKMGAFLVDLLEDILPILGGVMDTNNGLFSNVFKAAKGGYEAGAIRGQNRINDPKELHDASSVENPYYKETFVAKTHEILEDGQITLEDFNNFNNEEYLNLLEAVVPSSEAEVRLLKDAIQPDNSGFIANSELNDAITQIRLSQGIDGLYELNQRMVAGLPVQDAVTSLANGQGITETFEAIKAENEANQTEGSPALVTTFNDVSDLQSRLETRLTTKFAERAANGETLTVQDIEEAYVAEDAEVAREAQMMATSLMTIETSGGALQLKAGFEALTTMDPAEIAQRLADGHKIMQDGGNVMEASREALTP